MPTIPLDTKRQLLSMMGDELRAVEAKAQRVARERWTEAEAEVATALGYGDTVARIEHLKNEIVALQDELQRLEATVVEKAEKPSPERYAQAGFDVNVDRFGKVYSSPRVFERELNTIWDLLVFEYLNTQVGIFAVYKGLRQLHHTMRREMLLAGNFVEARELYAKFHAKIRAAVGQEVPALLSEIEDMPTLRLEGRHGEENA